MRRGRYGKIHIRRTRAFPSVRRLLPQTEEFIRGAISKIRLFHPRYVPSEQLFLKAISEGENDFEAIAIVGKYKKRRIQAPLLSVRRLPSGYGGVLRR